MSQTGSEVDGAVLQAVVDGIDEACGHFSDRAKRLLADHDLPAEPESGQSYPLEAFLDLLETIEHTTGPHTLARIGEAVPGLLTWPRSVTTTSEALGALDRVLSDHHSDLPGSVTFERIDGGTGRIRSTTPYPAAFERGLFEGIGERFPSGSGFVWIEQTHRRNGVREYRLSWAADCSPRALSVSDGDQTGPSPVSGD
jgi:hypothetical protein